MICNQHIALFLSLFPPSFFLYFFLCDPFVSSRTVGTEIEREGGEEGGGMSGGKSRREINKVYGYHRQECVNDQWQNQMSDGDDCEPIGHRDSQGCYRRFEFHHYDWMCRCHRYCCCCSGCSCSGPSFGQYQWRSACLGQRHRDRDQPDTFHRWRKNFGRSNKPAWRHFLEQEFHSHKWRLSGTLGCSPGQHKYSLMNLRMLHRLVPASDGGGTNLGVWRLVSSFGTVRCLACACGSLERNACIPKENRKGEVGGFSSPLDGCLDQPYKVVPENHLPRSNTTALQSTIQLDRSMYIHTPRGTY